jgi:hypothetical protein
VIHDEFGCGEGIAAVAGGRGDEDDRVLRVHQAGAVDHQQAREWPAGFGLGGKGAHARQGERFVVPQFEGLDIAFEANLAEERDQAAGGSVGGGEGGEFAGRLERGGFQADDSHFSRR